MTSKRKIAVITGCNDAYLPLADLTVPNKQEYCRRHKYQFIFDKKAFNAVKSRHAWEKLTVVLRHLERFEWVLWTDIDSLIMNMDQRLEDLIDDKYSAVASLTQFLKEDPHIHFGNILFKNDIIISTILKNLYEYKHRWRPDDREEEGAFMYAFWQSMPMIQGFIKRLPWSAMFSLPEGFPKPDKSPISLKPWEYKPGMFIVHATKPLDLTQRVDILTPYVRPNAHSSSNQALPSVQPDSGADDPEQAGVL